MSTLNDLKLKIKSKSLAEEARIIRKEENKLKRMPEYFRPADYLESITNHRRWNVRIEARATHLARAFLKGKSYDSVENSVKNPYEVQFYILPRVHTMVMKYKDLTSPRPTKEEVAAWLNLKI